MLSIRSEHLSIASKILLARLAKPATLDVVILDSTLDDLGCKLDNHTARFIGCFDLRPDDVLVFYLAARQHPDEDITHVFVYYMNCENRIIRDSELNVLKPYIANIDKPESGIKIGLISIRSSFHPLTYLSTMIEVIDFTMSPKLIYNFASFQLINVDLSELAIGSSLDQNVLNCDGKMSMQTREDFKKLAEYYNANLTFWDEQITDPQFVMLKTNNHFIGLLFSNDAKLVNYVLCHPNQFVNDAHYASVKQGVKRLISRDVENHYCTRYYADKSTRCDSIMMLTVYELVLAFRPHILTTIREKEIRFLISQLDKDNRLHMSISSPINRGSRRSVASLYNNRTEFCRLDVGCELTLVFSSRCKYPLVIREEFDSQATVILSDYDVKHELSFWREISDSRRKIKDSIVPPIHKIEPFLDLTQSYLKFLPCYEEAIKYQSLIWSKYAKTIAFKRVTCSSDIEDLPKEDARFLMYPLLTHKSEDCIVIVDRLKREWILIKPGNEEHKDTTYFNEVFCKFLFSCLPTLEAYNRRVVPTTSVFHKDYCKLHVIMSVYLISRLFRYSVELPQKLVYGEWELRKYASNICLELQLVNSEYNLSNDLVDERGELLEGAYESLPSPLVFETAVVPKDQCMFCKKRGFKNLGRHLSMQHGNQALMANNSRLEFD